MTKFGATALLFAILSLPAIGAPPKSVAIPWPKSNERIITPPDSPVRFSRFGNEENERVAIFEGRFLLTGTYYYGDAEFNDGGTFIPEAAMIPDPGVIARLPRFALRNKDYTIHIGNADAFAEAVVSTAMLKRVRRKDGGYATGHIAIWVDHFEAEIVCDGAEYGVRFLSVYRSAQSRLASNEQFFGC